MVGESLSVDLVAAGVPMIERYSAVSRSMEDTSATFSLGSCQKIVQEDRPPARRAWQIGYHRK